MDSNIRYGDEVMMEDVNRRAIEAEAKMWQDAHNAQHGKGAAKLSNEANEEYEIELYDIVDSGGFEDSEFFHKWGNRMSPDKVYGDTSIISRDFEPELLNFYFRKRGK